jgi:hypothetical protein
MSKLPRPNPVPKAMQAAYAAVTVLTDQVCQDRLNEEYRDLARAMTAALCRKRPSPLVSGQPRTWACGIVYLLGQLNFLSDKSFDPCMTTADLCDAFGVGQSTASGKSRVIASALKAHPMDPAWTLPSLLDQNPMVWMATVNGLMVDLRQMPREVQVAAFERGIIPYVPADRH